MKKKFLISIDTEGDNLWNWRPGMEITAENAKYLPRFQTLCDEYGFKPTYLTNYEMAADPFFADFAKKATDEGRAEIGMHLHAWNSPPEYPLAARSDTEPGAAYLIEYPEEIMEKKIAFMTELLKDTFGTAPVTHRAGRWTVNDSYFRLLSKYGYLCDCSVTPGKSWAGAPGLTPGSAGSDHLQAPLRPYKLNESGLIEIPVTVREDHRLRSNPGEGIKKAVRNRYRAVKGQGKIWLRPDGRNLDDLLYLTRLIADSPKDDYIMFMLHSSEFMPGGSGRFNNEESIEKLYETLGILFREAEKDFEGETIGEYSRNIITEKVI